MWIVLLLSVEFSVDKMRINQPVWMLLRTNHSGFMRLPGKGWFYIAGILSVDMCRDIARCTIPVQKLFRKCVIDQKINFVSIKLTDR
ncbi:MAG: hypothetical protein A3I13_05860 [Gammaproteobacteria bacterium RIFCSPLOWO2_02_FULL_47_50]|jgi:hypothetical protein|nr:MAG: hypothetical protein A3I13_05860 [Gammaproteobacteria bacterium RIFCSPLOWO2_02_FULL_47_50]